MRPANILSAFADILLGFAASGAVQYTSGLSLTSQHWPDLALLLLSTFGLYGGGVVFNDVFDADLDRVERPERPIPSGRVSVREGATLGIFLLLIGIIAAFMVHTTSGILAITVAVLAVVYDAYSKHFNLLGPLNMGLCRGGNLLLGVSVIPAMVPTLWFLAIIPIIYIAAITTISQGEVHGGNTTKLRIGLLMYMAVFICIALLPLAISFRIMLSIPFLLLFAYLIFPPLIKAIQEPAPQLIGKSVKAGVLSLIVMDAAISSGFVGWFYGLLILILLPLSLWIAQRFKVT